MLLGNTIKNLNPFKAIASLTVILALTQAVASTYFGASNQASDANMTTSTPMSPTSQVMTSEEFNSKLQSSSSAAKANLQQSRENLLKQVKPLPPKPQSSSDSQPTITTTRQPSAKPIYRNKGNISNPNMNNNPYAQPQTPPQQRYGSPAKSAQNPAKPPPQPKSFSGFGTETSSPSQPSSGGSSSQGGGWDIDF